MNIQNIMITHNIGDNISDIKNSLINECLSQRDNHDKKSSFNYEINSKHTNYLYDILYQFCKNKLNNFSLSDVNFKIWCYLSDENFNEGRWHNHENTSSINCVIYLKTEGKGIFFKHKDESLYVLPKENDMLIFPAFLDHYPVPSKKEPRITLNLELRCKEPINKIFNI